MSSPDRSRIVAPTPLTPQAAPPPPAHHAAGAGLRGTLEGRGPGHYQSAGQLDDCGRHTDLCPLRQVRQGVGGFSHRRARRRHPRSAGDPATRASSRVDDADLAMIRVLSMFSPKVAPADPGVPRQRSSIFTATVAPPRIGAPASSAPTAASPFVVLHPGSRSARHPSARAACCTRASWSTTAAPSALSRSCANARHHRRPTASDGRPRGNSWPLKDPASRHRPGQQRRRGRQLTPASTARQVRRDTVIGDGTKIDNLVQIGHNIPIGRA